MKFARLLLLIGCGATVVPAADPPVRPACTAANVGRFWPEEANDNPQFAKALMPYGFPQVCTYSKGAYGWRSMTVAAQRLRKDRGPKKSAIKR